MIYALCELALGCFLVLLYFGKVTTGKGEQHAAMLRQQFGKLFLVTGIATIAGAVVRFLTVILYPGH